MADTTTDPTFWQSVWLWIKKIGHMVMAPLPALLLVAGAIILVGLGFKNIQIGGLLGKLFGKNDPAVKAIDVANSVPDHRVDKDGKIIPIGTSDDKGMTQAEVIPIEPTGLFSNPDSVTIKPKGQDPIEVKLPTGVKASDVDHVISVKPNVLAVGVKDSSGITTQKVDDLLAKYRS